MPAELKLKGVNFRGLLGAVERQHGKDAAARVLAAVPGPAGEALRSREVVAGGWYAASWYDALLRAIEVELGAQEPMLIRTLAREAVKDDFKTLFKIVSLIASPERAMDMTQRVLSRYVDGGKPSVIEAREGSIHCRFEDYYGYTRRMWEDFIGGMEAILDLMKLKRLTTRVLAGGADGDDRLEVVLRYNR